MKVRRCSRGRTFLAEGGKVKIDLNGVAFGRSDEDGGGSRGERFSKELKFDGGSGQGAAALIGALHVGMPSRSKWPHRFFIDRGLHVEVFPEIVGTGRETGGGIGSRGGGANYYVAIGFGEQNFDNDFYCFFLSAVIDLRLLGTIAGGMLAGGLDREGKGSKERNGGDVWAGFGLVEIVRVLVEGPSHGVVSALAKEIGFTDGLFGEGGIEGQKRLGDKQKGRGDCQNEASRRDRHSIVSIRGDYGPLQILEQ